MTPPVTASLVLAAEWVVGFLALAEWDALPCKGKVVRNRREGRCYCGRVATVRVLRT